MSNSRVAGSTPTWGAGQGSNVAGPIELRASAHLHTAGRVILSLMPHDIADGHTFGLRGFVTRPLSPEPLTSASCQRSIFAQRFPSRIDPARSAFLATSEFGKYLLST